MSASGEFSTIAATQDSAGKSRWLQRFCPNRLDGVMLLFAFLWVVALLDPLITVLMSKHLDVTAEREFILTAIGGCVVALAFAAGRSRLHRKTGVAVLLACAFSIVLLAFSEFQVFSGMTTPHRGFGGQATGEGGLGFWSGFAVVCLVVFLVIWLTTLAISNFMVFLGSKFGSGKKIGRQKLLIVFAVGLFVAQLIQRVFFTGDGGGAPSVRTNFLIWQSILGGGTALMCAVVVGNFLTDNFWKLRWKLTLIALFLGCASFLVQSSPPSKTNPNWPWMAASFGIGFLLTLLIANSVVDDSEEIHPNTRSRRPSFWSSVAMGFVACAAFVVITFDVHVLRESKFQDWQLARSVKTMRRDSNEQVRLDPARRSTPVVNLATCRLRDDAAVDILACLEGKKIVSLSIFGLTPDIDTRPIKGKGAFLSVSDSKITSRQLKDLFEGSTWGGSLVNVEVVDSKKSLNLSGVRSLSIESNRPGQIASILKVIGSMGSLNHVRVGVKRLSIDDVEAIVKFSEKKPIVGGRGLVESLQETNADLKLSLRNLVFDFTRYSDPLSDKFKSESENAIQFALQNDIFLVMPRARSNALYWDLVFAKNVEAYGGFEPMAISGRLYSSNENDLAKDAERFHWSFGQNNTGQITDLFLPCGESFLENLSPVELTPLKSVETLGFEPLWLNRIDRMSAWMRSRGILGVGREISGQAFASMPNLKRLDLSPNATVTNANFLNLVPKIEHLQVRFSDSVKSKVDFTVCRNLKSLVYIGTPPKSTMKELAALKMLERVIVIDQASAELFQAAAVKNLESSIPGVKIQVISESDFLPDPPPKFKRHVQLKSVELREKLLKTDDESRSFDEASSLIDNGDIP